MRNELEPANRITVDLAGLMELLGCGRRCAERIAKESNARFKVGKRTLYSVSKVTNYVNQLAEKGV